MKIMITESQVKNLIGVITEAFETMPFKISYKDSEMVLYNFSLNGLNYFVSISYEDENYYSLSFGFTRPDGDFNPENNSNLDLKHLNTVLFTTAKITEDFVKNHPNIEVMLIHASYDKNRGESDEDDNSNIRTRIYARFLKTMNLNIKSFDVDEEANRLFVNFT